MVAVKQIIKVNNQYILATSAGVVAIDDKGNKKTLFPDQRTASIAYDGKTNTLWIGAQKGLYIYDIVKEEAKLWLDDDGISPGVSAMLFHGDELILGTLTDGIHFFKNEVLSKKITTKQGLPSNRISSIKLHNGKLWAGTIKGLASIDLTDVQVNVFDYTKGLAASEIYDLAFFNNQLWVTHPNGLQKFISLPYKNTKKSLIHLSSAESNNQFIDASTSRIILSPESNQLSLRFDVSNNLRSQGASKIFYRIPELNEAWNLTTLQNPIANYHSLPYGNFTFEAFAENEDGIKSANSISLSITVQKPFWKQTWFMVSGMLLIFIVAGFILMKRMQAINEKAKAKLLQQNQEQQLRIARLTSIRAQMNPHFIFNTLSSIQGKILNGQLQEANESIQSFAQLLRKVLELSSHEMIPLQEEIEVLKKYFTIEKDRFDGLLEYEINIDDEAAHEYIRIPSLLTQPFVENALRHGLMHKTGKKKLTVDFAVRDEHLQIKIEDNGIGRQAAEAFNRSRGKSHQSFALDAWQKRIDLLNTAKKRKIDFKIIDKHNEHGIAAGTTVIINLPLQDDFN